MRLMRWLTGPGVFSQCKVIIFIIRLFSNEKQQERIRRHYCEKSLAWRRKDREAALNVHVAVVMEVLKAGGSVQFISFVSFEVKGCAARSAGSMVGCTGNSPAGTLRWTLGRGADDYLLCCTTAPFSHTRTIDPALHYISGGWSPAALDTRLIRQADLAIAVTIHSCPPCTRFLLDFCQFSCSDYTTDWPLWIEI